MVSAISQVLLGYGNGKLRTIQTPTTAIFEKSKPARLLRQNANGHNSIQFNQQTPKKKKITVSFRRFTSNGKLYCACVCITLQHCDLDNTCLWRRPFEPDESVCVFERERERDGLSCAVCLQFKLFDFTSKDGAA